MRMQKIPALIENGLWPAQIKAIKNLEHSLAANRPRALVQMATGSGKTFTAINLTYHLIKFGGVKRMLFLVDRGNLGDQTLNLKRAVEFAMQAPADKPAAAIGIP